MQDEGRPTQEPAEEERLGLISSIAVRIQAEEERMRPRLTE